MLWPFVGFSEPVNEAVVGRIEPLGDCRSHLSEAPNEITLKAELLQLLASGFELSPHSGVSPSELEDFKNAVRQKNFSPSQLRLLEEFFEFTRPLIFAPLRWSSQPSRIDPEVLFVYVSDIENISSDEQRIQSLLESFSWALDLKTHPFISLIPQVLEVIAGLEEKMTTGEASPSRTGHELKILNRYRLIYELFRTLATVRALVASVERVDDQEALFRLRWRDELSAALKKADESAGLEIHQKIENVLHQRDFDSSKLANLVEFAFRQATEGHLNLDRP